MRTIKLEAPAKLNLTLDILGLRQDGYHELAMLMQAVSLEDTVTICQNTGGNWVLRCTDEQQRCCPDIPQDGHNLAWKAAKLFYAATEINDGGIAIDICKRIPSQAGLAGGSADAAAVLRGLNLLNHQPLSAQALCELGAKVGSDVPFCLAGGTAMVYGRGEIVVPEEVLTCQYYIICKPEFGISTPKLFALSDRHPASAHPDAQALLACLRRNDAAGAGKLLCNVLAPIAAIEHPEILSIGRSLLSLGACGAQMTGSGSAVFGLFPDEPSAKSAASIMEKQDLQVFCVRSV